MRCQTPTCARQIPDGEPECPFCGWQVPTETDLPVSGGGSAPAPSTSALRARASGDRRASVLAGAALVVAATAVVVGLLAPGRSDSSANETAPAAQADDRIADAGASGPATGGALPDTSTTTTTTTTSQDQRSPTAPEPTLAFGTWVTVADSLASGAYTRDEALQRARELGPQVRVVRSDDYQPDLRPGYWALVIDGWPRKQAARTGCADVGLSVGSQCYPKYLDNSAEQ